MEEQKTTFLGSEKTGGEVNPGNIFQELQEELTAVEMNADAPAKNKHPLIIASKVSGMLFILAFIATIVLSIDSGIRNYADSAFEGYPSFVCSYLAIGVNADNPDCHGVSLLSQDIASATAQIEKDLAGNLFILVPKRAQVNNIGNSDEVQFIKQHSGKNRTSITSMIDAFDAIRVSVWDLDGADIECSNYSIDEKGNLSVECFTYGSSLLSSSQKSNTSRMTAVAFLDKIQSSEKTGGFVLQNYPKSLDIEKFTSTDPGIKSTFSTKTKLTLKLRYVAFNQ